MVISTCHTLVTGYHYRRYLTLFPRNQMTHAEERMLDIRNMTKDSGDRTLHIIEVRLCIRQYLLGFFHLGRGNHIHGIGNLHCVLDTAYPAFYFSCICHKFLLCNICLLFCGCAILKLTILCQIDTDTSGCFLHCLGLCCTTYSGYGKTYVDRRSHT